MNFLKFSKYPIVFYVSLFLFFSVGTKEVHDEFLVYHVVVIFGALLALLVYFVTSPLRTPRFHSVSGICETSFYSIRLFFFYDFYSFMQRMLECVTGNQ